MVDRLRVTTSVMKGNLIDACEEQQDVRVCQISQLTGRQILLHDRTRALESVRLLQNRDPAATSGDHDLSGLNECIDGIDLNNINRLRRGNNPAVSAFDLDNIIALALFLLRFLLRENAPDHLDRMVECLVVWIHDHLRDHS